VNDARRFVGLQRGINVGGNKKIPMAQLREVAADVGLSDVATYIQSGNIVWTGPDDDGDAQRDRLEQAIKKTFGFEVEVIVVGAARFRRIPAAMPWPKAADRPKMVHAGFSRRPINAGAADVLMARATNEVVAVVDGVLWIDFKDGAAKTALSPAAIDKAVGSTTTLRNINTIAAIRGLLGKA
jgi:uncharacterized protein (DUF1697 family)